ncbi:MAG TPA: hypothetical protein VG123_02070, partial [Streptosporangiaceae bacterium]|nr:hypothetical protein [Streptosporangiaceae bacterium]
IYAYSFILTNLDVSAPDKAAAAEHWYRHRTTVEGRRSCSPSRMSVTSPHWWCRVSDAWRPRTIRWSRTG